MKSSSNDNEYCNSSVEDDVRIPREEVVEESLAQCSKNVSQDGYQNQSAVEVQQLSTTSREHDERV